MSESGAAGPGKGKGVEVGYVALAVSGEGMESVTREWESGNGEREENMVGFAVEGLRLVGEAAG